MIYAKFLHKKTVLKLIAVLSHKIELQLKSDSKSNLKYMLNVLNIVLLKDNHLIHTN